MDHTTFDDWLECLPDKDIPEFAATASAMGLLWATEHHDLIAETCFTDFSGDNPKEWAEDAVDIIRTSCKRTDEAEHVVMQVVNRTLERLGVPLHVS